jgi:hypothetical protein
MPYFPKGSLAERVMQNLKTALKIFHHHSQERWDVNLHLLTFALNTAYHESMRMSPDRLFLGRELNTPLENVWDLKEVNSSHNEQTRREFWTKAIRNLQKAKDRVAKRYNQTRKESRFKVDDIVCWRQVLSSKAKGVSQKLELRWSKPLVIVKFLGQNVVQLAVPDTGVVVRKAHLSQIKRYCM